MAVEVHMQANISIQGPCFACRDAHKEGCYPPGTYSLVTSFAADDLTDGGWGRTNDRPMSMEWTAVPKRRFAIGVSEGDGDGRTLFLFLVLFPEVTSGTVSTSSRFGL